MTENGLRELMRESTAHLPRPDLVPGALARAHRTRRRRTVAAVAAAVALVTAGTLGVVGLDPDAPAPVPAERPPHHTTMPPLDASLTRGRLVPHAVAELPTTTWDAPADLTPHNAVATPPGQARFVTKDLAGAAGRLFALDTSDRWHRIDFETHGVTDPLGLRLRPGSLAPDGRHVVVWNPHAAYVVDLGSGATHRYPLAGLTDFMWQSDSIHLLLVGTSAAEVVDLGDHSTRTLPRVTTPRDGATAWGYAGDTLIRLVEQPHNAARTAFVEQRNGRVVRRVGHSAIGAFGLTDLIAGNGRIAVTGTPTFGTGPRARQQGPGLLVLDRSSYAGVAWLPISGNTGDYFDPAMLQPRGWLDGHRLLLSITPMPGRFQQYLVWDTSTGDLSRAGRAPVQWRTGSWATGLLG